MKASEIVDLAKLTAKTSKIRFTNRKMLKTIEFDVIRFHEALGNRVPDFKQCWIARRKLALDYKELDLNVDLINKFTPVLSVLPILVNLGIRSITCETTIYMVANIVLVAFYAGLYLWFFRLFLGKYSRSIVALELVDRL